MMLMMTLACPRSTHMPVSRRIFYRRVLRAYRSEGAPIALQRTSIYAGEVGNQHSMPSDKTAHSEGSEPGAARHAERQRAGLHRADLPVWHVEEVKGDLNNSIRDILYAKKKNYTRNRWDRGIQRVV
jgi:hypothetical protein